MPIARRSSAWVLFPYLVYRFSANHFGYQIWKRRRTLWRFLMTVAGFYVLAARPATVLRMTTADAQHVETNSTDCCTDCGTWSRGILSKPNRGKNVAAVLVKRNTVATPARSAMASA